MLHVISRINDAPPFVQAMSWDGDQSSISVSPNNQPPDDCSYICVIAVLDYWRLLLPHTRGAGVAHFSEVIEPRIIQDVRAGRALFVFDLSNEGPEFSSPCFDAIHSFLDSNGISGQSAVWLSQNRAIEGHYRSAYQEKRSSLLRFEHYDFYIKMTAHWFADAAWRTNMVTGDPASYASSLCNPQQKHRLALCMNATPRLHRVWAVAALHHYHILEKCLVSFTGLSYPKGHPLSLEGVQAELGLDLAYLQRSCADVAGMQPMRIDDFTDTGNQLVDKIAVSNYVSTYFSVVTETDFTAGEIDRITEKTVKTFCLGHPAFIIGNPGALRFATGLGFQAFPGLDSGYDAINHPPTRFTVVFSEVLAAVAAIQGDAVRWLNEIREVSNFNIRYAEGHFLRFYRDEHDRRVVASLQRWLAVQQQENA